MKKLTLLILSLAAIATGFAQQSSLEIVAVKKIKTDEVVTSLKVYNNVEVILTEDPTSTVKIVGERSAIEKIQVKISNGDLGISGGSEASPEKITVYVPANYLQSIYVHGASKVTSESILSNGQLDVNINGTGTVAIETTGMISQNTIGDYPLDLLTSGKEI